MQSAATWRHNSDTDTIKKKGRKNKIKREKWRILLFSTLCYHTRHKCHGTAIAAQQRSDRTDSQRTKRIEMTKEKQSL